MEFSITFDQIEEMILCIVQCDLSEDEAIEYAKSVLHEFNGID